jgi:hypothetical protein
MKWAVVASLMVSTTALARPPYEVLLDAKRSWTYDVVAGDAGQTIGREETLSVAKLERRGPYSLVVLEAKDGGDQATLRSLTLLVGPQGVREVLSVDTDKPGEKVFRDAYDSGYLPRVYLPATLKKQQFKRGLNRFGEDDRIYDLTGALNRRSGRTWRMTWKGTYRVPEQEGQAQDGSSKTKYAATVDYDPEVGLTLICPLNDEKLCLRLRP